MTIKISGVIAGVVAWLAAASSSASTMTEQGRYEWRPGSQAAGPRAPIAAPRRVWVASAMMAVGSGKQPLLCCETYSS